MKIVCKLCHAEGNFKTRAFFYIITIYTGLIITSIDANKKEELESVQGTLETVNYTAIQVDPGYTGPKLEDRNITLEFMKDLMKFYTKGTNTLHEKYAFTILKLVRDYFEKQPSLIGVKLKAKEKITICGDTHGNLHDILHIFDLNGLPSPKNRYIFNGDFVDRGPRSVECALICFGFKLLYPDTFFLNRGNHEGIKESQGQGGLAEQTESRYPGNTKLLHGFWEVFQWLPLAYVISSDVTEKQGKETGQVGAYAPTHGQVLVVHGGLFSKKRATLKDIRKLKRGRDASEAGEKSMMFDILWSDPGDKNGRYPNQLRYRSIQFGPDVTESFCNRNKIDYIIRSHVPLKEGYHVEHNGRIVTVSSATSYNARNKGAVVVLEAPTLKPKFTTYKSAESGYEDEKDIPVGKYNTSGVDPSAGGLVD